MWRKVYPGQMLRMIAIQGTMVERDITYTTM